MPDPKIHPETGIPSTLLVYNHPKVWKDMHGTEHTFTNRTIQYNPRTSGKGFYKALKGKRANIRGSLSFVRYMCQQRIIEMLGQRGRGNPPADPAPAGGSAVPGHLDGPLSGEAHPENVV